MKTKALIGFVVFLTGCSTLQLPAGPDAFVLNEYQTTPKVGITRLEDKRVTEKIGSIGANRIYLKEDLISTASNYIVHTFNKEMQLNVKQLESLARNANVIEVMKDSDVQRVVSVQIPRVWMYSFDAILQPVNTEVDMLVQVYNENGEQVFRRFYTGKYEKTVGLSVSERRLGKLVDEALKNLMYKIQNDQELKEILLSTTTVKTG